MVANPDRPPFFLSHRYWLPSNKSPHFIVVHINCAPVIPSPNSRSKSFDGRGRLRESKSIPRIPTETARQSILPHWERPGIQCRNHARPPRKIQRSRSSPCPRPYRPSTHLRHVQDALSPHRLTGRPGKTAGGASRSILTIIQLASRAMKSPLSRDDEGIYEPPFEPRINRTPSKESNPERDQSTEVSKQLPGPPQGQKCMLHKE